jgi:hypothetical protein
MSQVDVVKEIVNYFKSDQWQEYVRQIKQTEEEIYHSHLFAWNSVAPESIDKLFTGFFERIGAPLDRKIDILTPGAEGVIAAHNVHPHHVNRPLYTPHMDWFWKYNPDVVIQPSDPAVFGEEGQNILAWGKTYMDNYLKDFDFKCVGPREDREIENYFQSAHWKKGLRLIQDPLYNHYHINVEINFDPWILKGYAIEALKAVGYTVDHVVPCVYKGYQGKYQGKMVFLGAYPEEVYDIAWYYNPDVVIRPTSFEFSGDLPEDKDFRFNITSVKYRDELVARDKYRHLTDEQIEQVLEQVT